MLGNCLPNLLLCHLNTASYYYLGTPAQGLGRCARMTIAVFVTGAILSGR